MMGVYAKNTSVSVARSKEEIETTLVRYGADSFMYGSDGNKALVAFRANGKMLRFILMLPAKQDEQFKHKKVWRGNQHSGRYVEVEATPEETLNAWEQACRQKWRALTLVIKAKLEAVESGIEAFEQVFLANIMLPDGQTVGEWMIPQVEQAYLSGLMPAFLPMLPARVGER